MQIKEFEAYNLKDCLQKVRADLGPEAVILETRKTRKGGVMGWGAKDAICIVAAVGITVKDDLTSRRPVPSAATPRPTLPRSEARAIPQTTATLARAAQPEPDDFAIPVATRKSTPAARGLYARAGGERVPADRTAPPKPPAEPTEAETFVETRATRRASSMPAPDSEREVPVRPSAAPDIPPRAARPALDESTERFDSLENAMRDIRTGLASLRREQQETAARTASAVVSAVVPAVSAALPGLVVDEAELARFPALRARLLEAGVGNPLTDELLDELPDFSAWSEEARQPLAIAALRDLIGRRVAHSGPIVLNAGSLKAVALIGPTGVGKTTTIAKLAAHFALVERKRVALLTVDTYRIAAVEQLKTYSQILDIPINVAYSPAEVLPIVEQYRDFDLLLIDTAGRSQKNIMQVGELKTLLEAVQCETHLVLAAQTKEQDMMEAARRFAAARVDRLLFSKLDETSVYGTLLNVATQTGLPLSYLTTGQKVPEDLELADGSKLAGLLLD